ncbi:hypothetical protein K431DRAFT_287257 [Polychaeton citri CBS 116435]|uniref:Uncharacterized protein n=1 Tax=Polychaeton citri CBS 116435 TaxID=1314669 RepID=A0A9P4Q6B2_9PEZI|nr:hypothetical protein K431DRAFT_287257 [Polychaeton citri CBS 116435]
MDRASQALAADIPCDAPGSFRARADCSDVPRTTLQHGREVEGYCVKCRHFRAASQRYT